MEPIGQSLCPLDNIPKPVPDSLPIIDFEDLFVKLPGTNELMCFKKATNAFFKDHFPEAWNKQNKVPSALFYDQKGRHLEMFPDDEVKRFTDEEKTRKGIRTPIKDILQDRFQRDAVEKVAQAVVRLYSVQKEGVFVITEFKFCHFLKHVVLQQQSPKGRQVVHGVEGDHDLLIISRRHGVIFVQVKSTSVKSSNKTKRHQIRDAGIQIKKDVMAFEQMNRDLEGIEYVPKFAFIAMSEWTGAELKQIFVCSTHAKDVLLSNHINDDELFSKWFHDHVGGFDVCEEAALSNEIFELLCGRYVGLASSVRYRTLADAITATASKFSKIDFRILLTPQQNKLLKHGRNHQIICGDFGTGKSLVLVKRAEELSARGDFSYVVSFSVVSDGSGKVQNEDDNCVEYLQSLISDPHEKIKVMSFCDLHEDLLKKSGEYRELFRFSEGQNGTGETVYPFQLTPKLLVNVMCCVRALHEPETCVNFLLDEVPLSISAYSWYDFERFCEKNENTTVWLTISCCSYSLLKDEDPSCISEHLPSGISLEVLNRCMRMTKSGFQLSQAVRKYKDDGYYGYSKCGTAVNGPVPLWFEMEACRCPTETLDLFKCKCIADRLGCCLQTILKQVGDVQHQDITVLLHDTSSNINAYLEDILTKAFEVIKTPVKNRISGVRRNSASNSSEITVVDFWSFKGNESKVVIFIDPYGGPIVRKIDSRWHGWVDVTGAISRSLAQIVYLTWPEREQELFLDIMSSSTTEAAKNAMNDTSRSFLLGVAKSLENGRRAEGGNSFMKFLVRESVLRKVC